MRLQKRLNEMLHIKYEHFKTGINDVLDFTMKGALAYIKRLAKSGVAVYLASGTDLEDVRYETDTFGTTDYFTGGVFGSVGDISNDPKKIVMRNIIQNIDVSAKQVVVFGDGPVEIREGKKNGFLAIGVLSDEKQRYGMNLNKRERLILAGADILIPDFSWIPTLEDYLGWKNERI